MNIMEDKVMYAKHLEGFGHNGGHRNNNEERGKMNQHNWRG